MQNQKYILPIGFYDLLGNEAKINQQTIDLLLASFYQAQYHLIKTPLVEFAESLGGQKIDERSFKMVDNFSGKTLVLRSDITPQIARLMATKLSEVKMPIRLCYVGDVLQVKNDNLYADRQLTQVGVELIGEDSSFSNLEVIDLTLSALKKIQLENLILSFCCPQFLNILLVELDLTAPELKESLTKKNISVIKKLAGTYADSLILLALEHSDINKITAAIANLPLSQNTKNQLAKWNETVEEVKKNHPEINFLVDIFGDDEFFYHHQIGFTIFAGGFSYPIARGGRYMINQNISAVGSTIYINNLRKILIGG